MPECPDSRERERYDEIGKKIKREREGERERDASISQEMAWESLEATLMGTTNSLNLNTITPCAACKLLRRRCAEDCAFSPYFSPLEPDRFAVVHRVFGASNASKMLMEVPESQRAAVANSLVCEAVERLVDPVYGCMGAISALQQQVDLLQAELDATRAEISRYRYREAAANSITDHHIGFSTLGMIMSAAVLPPAPASPPPLPPPPPSLMVSSSFYTDAATSAMSYNPIPSNPYLDSYYTNWDDEIDKAAQRLFKYVEDNWC